MGDKITKLAKKGIIPNIFISLSLKKMLPVFMFLSQNSRYTEVLMVTGKQDLVFFSPNFALGLMGNNKISQLLLTYYLCLAEFYWLL
jgi:hypothetical protein